MVRQRSVLSVFAMAVLVLSTVTSFYPVGAPLPVVQSREAPLDDPASGDPGRTFLGEVYDVVVLQEYLNLQYEALEATIRQLEATGFGDTLSNVIDTVLASGRFVFLYFYATWCHFCQQAGPIVDALAATYADQVVFIRVDGELNPAAMTAFGVDGYPTMLLVYGRDAQGYQHADFVGYTAQAHLEDPIDYALAHRTAPPRDAADLVAALESLLTEWPHHTCDQGDCFNDCLNDLDDPWGTLSTVLEYLLNCGACAATLVGCCSSIAACTTVLGCIPSLVVCAACFGRAESMTGFGCSGCATGIGPTLEAIEHFLDAYATCQDRCEDPMSERAYGRQEDDCRAGDYEMGCTLSGEYQARLICEDCEWRVDESPEGLRPCPSGTHCVETPEGVECRGDEEDDDDDEPPRLPGPAPGGDHPDDTHSLTTLTESSSAIPEMYLEKTDVAVLERGYFIEFNRLLMQLGEPATFLDLGFSAEMAQEYPVLVVPSGGLYGLGSSDLFRERLEDYVSNGGTLLVFSQQRGSDYHAMPGGAVEGFGWIEDISCNYRSVGMSTYHPILSGNPPDQLSIETDGYFTGWPANAFTLLSRVKNGMPAMILYQYGAGRVIASTLYTDFALAARDSNLTPDEQRLFRNLITWAKNPQPMPDYAPGATVNVPLIITNAIHPSPSYPEYPLGATLDLAVNVTNSANVTSSHVSFLLVDPEYRTHPVNVSAAIPPNGTQTVHIPFETTTASLEGVWYVVYGLYSDRGGHGAGYGGAFTLGIDIVELSTYKITFTLLNPDGHVVDTRNSAHLVNPGETDTILFTFTPTEYGIWSLDYVVKDYTGAIIDFGLIPFTVSQYQQNPDGWAYRGSALSFSITSEQESYPYGTSATFTFHLWNDGDEDANVTVTWGFPHHCNRDPRIPCISPEIPWFLNPNYSMQTFIDSIVVPAEGYASFVYVLPAVIELDRLWANFYLNLTDDPRSVVHVGSADRGIWMVQQPSLGVAVTTDQERYLSGETVAISVNVSNWMRDPYDLNVTLTLLDPDRIEVWNATFPISLSTAATWQGGATYTLPSPTKDGDYVVQALVLFGQARVRKTTQFEVAPYQLRVTRSVPAIIYPNVTATITLTVTNTGEQDTDGRLNVTLVDVDGQGVWSDARNFPVITVNGTNTFSFAVPFGDLRLGTYRIRYTLDYGLEERFGGSIEVPSSLVTEVHLDQPSYRARENMTLTLRVTNDGTTYQDRTLSVFIPVIQFATSSHLQLAPNATTTVEYRVTVLGSIEAGSHVILVRADDDVLGRYHFIVPDSMIGIDLSSLHVAIGENLVVGLENRGGSDTSITLVMFLRSATGVDALTSTASATISVGETWSYLFSIPSTFAAGPYLFRGEVLDHGTDQTSTLTRTVWIDGLDVALTVETGRDVYQVADPIDVHSLLVNANGDLVDGVLHLEITHVPDADNETWTPHRNILEQVEAISFDADGTAWLGVDNVVLRFDGETWTQYTTAEGLGYFSDIHNVVIDASGNVWVAQAYGSYSVSVFNGSAWREYTSSNSGLVSDRVSSLAADQVGNVWIGTTYDGVSRFDGVNWTTYNATNSGLPQDTLNVVAVDPEDTVWIGTNGGVTTYNGTHWTTYNTTNSGIHSNLIDIIAFDLENRVWIGSYSGLSVFNHTHWTTFTTTDGLADNYVNAIAVDNTGQVWVGSLYDGVSVYNGSVWVVYDEANSNLESNGIASLAVDTTGTLWAGHGMFKHGISLFNGTAWTRLAPSLIHNDIAAITVDGNGDVWIGTGRGLSRFDGTQWSYYTKANSGLLDERCFGLTVDRDGAIWVTTASSSSSYPCSSYPERCGVSRYNGTTWTTSSDADLGVPIGYSHSIAVDPTGDVWFAWSSGVARYTDGTWTIYNATTIGFEYPVSLTSMVVDLDGVVYLGSERGGLFVFDGSAWTTVNATNSDLLNDWVADLTVDASNNLWVVHQSTFDASIGQNNGGVSVFNGSGWTTYDAYSLDLDTLNDLTTIMIDGSGRVWLGTDTYFILAFDNGEWTTYDHYDTRFDDVSAIAVDADGNIWFGSEGWGVLVYTREDASMSPVLWRHDDVVTLVEGSTNHTVLDIGTLGVTGKLRLTGVLRSSGGQIIDRSEFPFYVVDGDLVLMMNHDRDVYRPGEVLTISGEVRNLDTSPINDVTLTLQDEATPFYEERFDIPPNGSRSFTATLTAGPVGRYAINAIISQGASTLLTVTDQFDVVVPSVAITVEAPATVGWDPFPINVLVNNTGGVATTVTVNSTVTTTVPPGEVRLVQLTRQITETTTYHLALTGDYTDDVAFTVVFGVAADITLTPERVYPEGVVAVPYTVVNTGTLDVDFNVTFTLPGAPAHVQEVFLSPGTNQTGLLVYNLTEGVYAVTYTSTHGSGVVTLTVVRRNSLTLTVTEPERVQGGYRVDVNVSNVGANDVTGSIRIDTDFFAHEEPLHLPIATLYTSRLNLSTLDVPPGTYNVTFQVLVDGFVLHEAAVTLHVAGPAFTFVDVPVNASFPWGALANLTIAVRNAGDAAGDAVVMLTVPGIHAATQAAWIPADAVTPFTFTVPIPDDVAAGWYPVVVTLNGIRRQTALYVEGANVSVTASVDQPLYAEGANATVTLHVANRNGLNLSLYATVRSDTVEALLPFNLSSGVDTVLTFDVPVHLDGRSSQTVLYTVYLASGRALYINTLHLAPQPPPASGIALYTDRQVYAIGDTVTVTVNLTKPGFLNATAPNFHVAATVSEHTVYTFTIPPLLSGTYTIDYTFDGYMGSYPFDVDGYAARITAMTLDKTAYAVGEDVHLQMIVDARRAFEALVRVTLYDQYLIPIDQYRVNVSLVEGENALGISRRIVIGGLGLYAINPRIYVDLPAYSYAMVASGAQFFDVTADDVPPVVTIVSPTNATYLPGVILLNVSVNEPVSWIGYSLDGGATVTLYGLLDLTGLSVGSHALTVYSNDTSGNLAASTVLFTVHIDDAPPEPVTLDAPSAITSNSLTLTWSENLDADFSSYAVYQSTSPGVLGTVIHTLTDQSTTAYTVTELSPTTTYHFTVRVYDTGGLSADSNQVSATTTTAPPPSPTEFPWVYLIVIVAVVGVAVVFLSRWTIV